MQYYLILIVTVIASFQFYNIMKTRNAMKSSGNLISAYSHKSSLGGLYLGIVFQVLIYFGAIIKLGIYYVIGMSPLLVLLLLAYSRNSKKIELYENGILVFGDFVDWGEIDSIELDETEIQMVTSTEEPQYYTISQIKEGAKCYNQIIKYATHLTAHNAPVREKSDVGIEEFLKTK